jgi:serine/threonine-protein kinase RsbW
MRLKYDSIEKLTMIIPSLPDQIQLVEEKGEQMSAVAGFDDDDRDSLAIALTEVVANAIYHGNQGNPDKTVTICFTVRKGYLSVEITDQGPGFNPHTIADPLDPENLLKDSGRGIFIVRTLMDSVEYRFNQGIGTTVILTKHAKNVSQDVRYDSYLDNH